MKRQVTGGLMLIALLAAARTARTAEAQDSQAGSPRVDEGRFRFGVSGGVGAFSVQSEFGGQKVDFSYYGTDARFGYQINDLIGIYGQPTLGYYTADLAEGQGPLAVGGLLAATVLAEVTLVNRLFVGGGVGHTIYNSPNGLSALVRIGGYPLVWSGDNARRHGLMLGVDLRFTKLEGLKTIFMPSLNVGYEAF